MIHFINLAYLLLLSFAAIHISRLGFSAFALGASSVAVGVLVQVQCLLGGTRAQAAEEHQPARGAAAGR